MTQPQSLQAEKHYFIVIVALDKVKHFSQAWTKNWARTIGQSQQRTVAKGGQLR